jgi:hypothetical protein
MNGGGSLMTLVIAVLVFVASAAVSTLGYVAATWAVQRATVNTVSWTTAASLAALACCAGMALVIAGHQ